MLARPWSRACAYTHFRHNLRTDGEGRVFGSEAQCEAKRCIVLRPVEAVDKRVLASLAAALVDEDYRRSYI